MKKYLFGILAIVAIGLSAFTTKKVHKPLVSQDVFYNNGADKQRIESGFTGQGDGRENTMTGPLATDSYTNPANWNTTGNSATAYVSGDGSSYVKSFTINNFDNNTDLNDADGISIEQAIAKIYDVYINAGSVYPTSVNVVTDSNPLTPAVTVSNITRAESKF